jgi:hypothetical protein
MKTAEFHGLKRDLEKEMNEFFKVASLDKYIQFIETMEASQYYLSPMINVFKRLTFAKMLDEANAVKWFFRTNNKNKYPTEMYMNFERNECILFISKKDTLDLDAVYLRLYDECKEDLIRMIELRSSVQSEQASESGCLI